MKKIKIERCMKLRGEDFKNRGKYDIVSGRESPDTVWIDSFGKQANSSYARSCGINKAKNQRDSENATRSHWTSKLNLNVRPVENKGPIV